MLFGGLLLASASVTSVSTDFSELLEDFGLLVGLGDLAKLNSVSFSDKGQGETGDLVSGSSGLKLLSSGIVNQTLLWLVLTSWEHDQFALIGVESSNVKLELLLTGRGSSVVNRDTNRSSEGGGETSTLEFLESETTAVANFTSILTGSL